MLNSRKAQLPMCIVQRRNQSASPNASMESCHLHKQECRHEILHCIYTFSLASIARYLLKEKRKRENKLVKCCKKCSEYSKRRTRYNLPRIVSTVRVETKRHHPPYHSLVTCCKKKVEKKISREILQNMLSMLKKTW